MWIFLKDAFISITRSQEPENLLLVRARFRGDIERIYPEADVSEYSGTDYRYRALISNEILLQALRSKLQKIDYSDFSGSIESGDNVRRDTYKSVLQALRNSQTFSKMIEEG